MEIPEILDAMLAELDKGWHQGDYYSRDEEGNVTGSCLLGARNTIYNQTPILHADSRHLGSLILAAADRLFPGRRVNTYGPGSPWSRLINPWSRLISFNDDGRTTAEDVKMVVKQAKADYESNL
jgi:hypothetical protein